MRYLFLSFLVFLGLNTIQSQIWAADAPLKSSLSQNPPSSPDETFYTTTAALVQDRIDLIIRMEKAVSGADTNLLRAVRGQLTLHESAVERFLVRYSPNPRALCIFSPASPDFVSPDVTKLTEEQTKIYCSLYTGSQQLLKLKPTIDRLIARRGEITEVRRLTLVSGEPPQVFPDFKYEPVERPKLGEPAIPLFAREPNLPATAPPLIGRTGKKPIAEYVEPIQPAFLTPPEAIAILRGAKLLTLEARAAFPPGTEFKNPAETNAALERLAYDLDPKEPPAYAEFLAQPNTGIFRVLLATAYRRPLNTVQNRLSPSVAERYPFPVLAQGKGELIPRLTLQVVDDQFQMLPDNIDYGFMVDLGDVPLEKLDANLKVVPPEIRQFFGNYQPPQQLAALQSERRRFLSGKQKKLNQGIQDVNIVGQAPAVLNHTYLLRNLQFQLPDIILQGGVVSRAQRLHIDQLLQMQSSDVIVAFRPVRRHPDGSYTILWRFVKQLNDPKITDLEAYLQLQQQ
jgi:hypothetical protein